ncbi:MAG TPA: PTS sugar transporter subunit IIA, partial [Candidatus Kapabacteria bacterium]|nr:PTS sugar transporter subunit IIA [Candidatus Kapabacteria bacterium]
MELKIKDLTALLNIEEKTLLQWIRDKKIPNYKINHQYLFNKTEIKEWILQNNIQVSDKILELNETNTPVKLSQLIARGGIHFNIAGKTPIEVIKNAVHVMSIPPEVDEETVAYSLIEREEMMPTAIGKGIAIPHPRNPIIADIDHENITLCLLEEAINYNALDNEPV